MIDFINALAQLPEKAGIGLFFAFLGALLLVGWAINRVCEAVESRGKRRR